MSLAENLLNSLDATAYQNTRIAGSGEEEHIKVGKDRVITVPNALKTIAVKGDKDVETATVDCVRYWDGHDLSTFAIYLNYILPNMDEGTYIPESITKSEDTFSFDWKIGSEFTYSQGKLTFWIVAKLTDNSGTLVRQWSSFQNSDCSIAQGSDKIYVPEKQTDQDVITQAISISRASAEFAEQQANLAIEAANKAALDASQAAEEEVSRIIGELGVVQELGDSPNSVVSQLKVTKEFNKTNAKINRNSKRITNLEQGIPAEMFETDSTMAYQKDVPENALPYAEVKKIGGMTRKCSNLCGIDDITVSNENYLFRNKPMRLSAGTYTFSFKAKNYEPTYVYQLTIFDSSGAQVFDFSTYVNESCVKTFEITRESAYANLYTNSPKGGTFYDFMLNEGSTAQPYEPYFEGLRSAKVTEVKSVGVNLWDEEWEVGGIDADNGDIYYATDRIRGVNYCHCLPNTQYWVPPYIHLAFYNKDKSYVGQAPGNNVITTPDKAYYFKVCGTAGYGTTYNNDIIIAKSTTAQPYTPYVGHTLPIPEAVQALDGYGLGISDTIYNYIDWENKQFVKRVAVKVFNGTERLYDHIAIYNEITADSPLLHVPLSLLASHDGISSANKYSFSFNATRFNVKSTDEMAAYLAQQFANGTPVTVIYELEEPIVTDISDILSADNLIGVEGCGTLTFENEYRYAVPSEVEYQVEV